MAKYVLVSDTTLSHDYKNFPLLDFLPSAPTELLPEFIYNYLKGKPPPDINGRASLATYPLKENRISAAPEAQDRRRCCCA